MSGALTVRDLAVRYGRRPVLAGLTLPPLEPGEVTVLLGPNGAGKSTLLRAMAGLQAHAGEIALGDTVLSHLSARARAALTGFMPQMPPGVATLTVLEGVIASLRAAGDGLGGGAGDAAGRAMAVLDRLGIAPLAMEGFDRLSGGQRQLAGLAQAIAREPRLLLLDEPTSALDLARSFHLMAEVRAYAARGRIVVAVLHDLHLAARWADRILVLHGGGLYASGTPAEVLTPAMLAEVYGVEARVERCSRGWLTVQVDGLREAG